MLHLDNNTKKQEEDWLTNKVKGMKPEEKENFLIECANYFLLFDKYTQHPEEKKY